MKFLSMVNSTSDSSPLVAQPSEQFPRPQSLSFGNAEDMDAEMLPPAAPKLGPQPKMSAENMEITNLPSAASSDFTSSQNYGNS